MKRDSGTGVFLWIMRNFLRTPLFFRTSPVAASVKIRTKSVKLAKFQFQPFLYTWYYGFPLHCDITVVKGDIHRKKIFVVVTIHIAIQTQNIWIKVKTVCIDMYLSVEVFLHSQGGWCFEIVLWMIWVLGTRVTI